MIGHTFLIFTVADQHYFQVHLVSEHIWCDDYLVRSVYLKNTRTGETRTVTQFHFRSWPSASVPTSTVNRNAFWREIQILTGLTFAEGAA